MKWTIRIVVTLDGSGPTTHDWRVEWASSVGEVPRSSDSFHEGAVCIVWGLARKARGSWYLPSRDCGGDVMELSARVRLARRVRR